MASLAQINVLFRANLEQFSSEMQNVRRMTEKASKDLEKIGKQMSLAVTAPLAAMGAAAIKYGSDYEESVNKVEVAFKKSSAQIREFASTSLETYGIAEGTALDMAALFGDMATSMGIPQKKAAELSASLVGLAGDLASFKNIGIEQATTALNGVFTGETESLKMLGIVMTEANLQQYAYSQGIRTKIKDMSQAQKVELRYAYVMSQTANAQGDFARTGGGAANQMRIFQEGLKQLAAQFGQVILPAFTKAISHINTLIKAFGGLSEGTKTTIVVVAGLAAAIGPALYAIGTLTAMMPKITAGIESVKNAFKGLTTAMAANPLLAITAAVALGIAAFAAYRASMDTTVDKARLLAEVNETAAKSVAKEASEMDTLVKIARDETRTRQERAKAIEKINAISPEMLGNITLETINTDKSTEAIKAYNKMLNEKAFQQALASKKQELFNKLIEKETANLTSGGPTQGVFDWLAADLLGFEQNLIRNQKELDAYIKKLDLNGETAEALRRHYSVLIAEREKEKAAINAQISALDDLAKVVPEQGDAVTGTGEAVRRTIEYYQKLIDEQREIQRTLSESNASFSAAETKIEAYQKAIDKISGKREKLEPVALAGLDMKGIAGSVDDFEKQISVIEDLQKRFATTSTQFKFYAAEINALKFKIEAIDTEPFAEAERQMGKIRTVFVDTGNALSAVSQAVVENVGPMFEEIGTRFSDSLGLAATGMQGFMKVMIDTATKLISALLAECIALAIKTGSISAAFSGPGAIFAQPVFISTAIAGVMAAFAKIPKFEYGGVVGGNSFYGDKILARLNSGELVLNQNQQKNLMNLIEPAGTNVNIVLDGAFKINGSDLELILERVAKRNNRIK